MGYLVFERLFMATAQCIESFVVDKYTIEKNWVSYSSTNIIAICKVCHMPNARKCPFTFATTMVKTVTAVIALSVCHWFSTLALADEGNYGDRPALVSKARVVTGSAGESISKSNRVWTPRARHLYSKVQAWNCDESLLWVSNWDSAGTQVFLSGNGKDVIWVHDAPGREMRWMPDQPSKMLYVGNTYLGVWDVSTGQSTKLLDFPFLVEMGIGPYEGNLSRDGKWLVVTGIDTRNPDRRLRSSLINLETLSVKSSLLHPEDIALDWISVSASGRYIV